MMTMVRAASTLVACHAVVVDVSRGETRRRSWKSSKTLDASHERLRGASGMCEKGYEREADGRILCPCGSERNDLYHETDEYVTYVQPHGPAKSLSV